MQCPYCLLLRQIGRHVVSNQRRPPAITIVNHPSNASHPNEKSAHWQQSFAHPRLPNTCCRSGEWAALCATAFAHLNPPGKHRQHRTGSCLGWSLSEQDYIGATDHPPRRSGLLRRSARPGVSRQRASARFRLWPLAGSNSAGRSRRRDAGRLGRQRGRKAHPWAYRGFQAEIDGF